MSTTLKNADEQEVFEIQDYTTASEWERFTANVEEILQDWTLTNNDRKNIPSGISLSSDKVIWQEEVTTINFADYVFTVTHHFLIYSQDVEQSIPERTREEKENENEELPQYASDLLNLKNDFPSKAHCLVRWFGLKEFITLSPAISSQPLLSPSKAKIVLSSLSIAANNTSCQVPLFLQTGELCDKVYLGVGYGSDVRTDFEMVYIKSPPPQCKHLSGLLDVFKNKIGVTLTSEPVLVSIRFTYILNDWPDTLWSQQPPDLDATLSDVGFSGLGRLPFGAHSDPVTELHVSTTWPCVNEYTLLDSDVQSDLNPSSAPLWSARLGSSYAYPCLLSEYLSKYIYICTNDHSILHILGPQFDLSMDSDPNIINALDRLTSKTPISSFASGSKRPHAIKDKQGPIGEDTLALLLNFLFPDAQSVQEESAPYSPASSFSHVPQWTPPVHGLTTEHPLTNVLRNMKSCSVDSFVYRLAIVLCHVTHSLGGLSAVAHLLYEVLLELRFRWDNAIFITGLAEGSPDMASCLVNQKLQMLNCCIERKVAREEMANKKSSDDTLDDEEEFFECDESVDSETEPGKVYSSWDKPEGRLKQFGKARLLNGEDFIYIPATQEVAPNTEDMLEEQTGELLRLGADSFGSCQRARLMSCSLLSDMESFKAANPGAVLEDFVQWYSPRDWIEDDQPGESGHSQVRGRLSDRMLIPGNMWKEVWENAKPVPARRQKRLFDDTREAEKVLQWFDALSPGRFCQEILPVVMHASLCRLAEEPVLYTLSAVKEEPLPQPLHDDSLSAQLELLAKRVSRLSRQPSSIPQYKSIYTQIEIIERNVAKAQSLRLKLLGHTNVSSVSLKTSFLAVHLAAHTECEQDSQGVGDNPSRGSDKERSPLESLVTDLLNSTEVALQGGPKGQQAAVIKKLFLDVSNSPYPAETPSEKEEMSSPGFDPSKCKTSRDIELGRPAGREYLLRTRAAFPADHSRVLPQRLYAVVLDKSFRMAGAITQDTLFC